VAIDAYRSTQSDEWRSQSDVNKQGSGEPISIETCEKLCKAESELHELSKEVYENRLECGVAGSERVEKEITEDGYSGALVASLVNLIWQPEALIHRDPARDACLPAVSLLAGVGFRR
jgi:hypothetical protein